MAWIDFIMRILPSILLGFLIGLARQITGHTAGIRINILTFMGSCLFLMIPVISGFDKMFRIRRWIFMQRGYFQRQWDRPGAQYSCYALMHSRNWCSGQF